MEKPKSLGEITVYKGSRSLCWGFCNGRLIELWGIHLPKGIFQVKVRLLPVESSETSEIRRTSSKRQRLVEWIKGGKVRAYVHSEHVKLPDNPERPRIDIYGKDRKKNLRGSYDDTDYGPIIRQRVEAQREATKRQREKDANDAWVNQDFEQEAFSTINYSGPNNRAPEVLETIPINWNQGEPKNMLNPIQKYRGTRTSVQQIRNRRASKYATLQHAKRMFWMSRFPTLTLRTYLPAGEQNALIQASSGTQTVYPSNASMPVGGADGATQGFVEFPTAGWCFEVLRKMHIDMTHHSANGKGEIHKLDNDLVNEASNVQRNGLTILDLTRTYTMMNVTNAIQFVEVYELVWKGVEMKENYDNPTTPAPIIAHASDYFHPSSLWQADLRVDDPDWGSSSSSLWVATDQNITINAPGARPNGKCKMLWKYWDLEKKTKYVLGAGQTVLHSVHLPAMYIGAGDLYRDTGDQVNNWDPNRIKNKTRHVMFIVHGQLGFEKSTTTSSEGRIEFIDTTMSMKMRQITKFRIQEANYTKIS